MPNEQRLPGIFALITTSWRAFNSRLSVYLGMGALVFAIAALFPILAAGLGIGLIGRADISSLAAGAVITSIVFIVLMVWASLAYLYLVRGHAEAISIKEAFRRAWGRLLSFVWLNIITSLILIGALLLVAGVPALALAALKSWIGAGVYAVIAIIVVLVIFATWGSFSNWLLIDSDYRGASVYAASRDLVRKTGFWQVFWRVAILTFLFGFLSSLVQGIGAEDDVLMGAVGSLVLYLVLWPVYFGALFALYQAARATSPAPEPRDTKWFVGIAIAGIVLIIALPLVGGYLLLSQLGTFLDALKNGMPVDSLDFIPTETGS